MDPDPDSESGSSSRGIKSLIKWREKQSLTKKKNFFRRKLFVSSLNLKKCRVRVTWNLKVFNFEKLKDVLKIGDFIDLDTELDWLNFVDPELDLDPDWSNFVEPGLDPDTINPDPHHWNKVANITITITFLGLLNTFCSCGKVKSKQKI